MKSMTYDEADQPILQEDAEISVNLARTRARRRTPATQRRSPTVRGPCVYFIQAGDAIKIGFTTHLPNRLIGIQGCCPIPIILLADFPGGRKDESDLHFKFASIRLHGEWHQNHPELLSFIEEKFGGPLRPITFARFFSFRPEMLSYD